ncbi:MAG TPA: DUF2017 family protein [Chthoniobacteraceae bacterium]|nr:DUF2017 family protein [Chthoniobacteraceae bacterium]
MEIARLEDGAFSVTGLEEPLVDFLKAIIPSCDPGEHPGAHDRLYPSPQPHGATAEAAGEDWREYVQPELEHLFASAAAIVKGDLKDLRVGGVLTIPAQHVDAWLNTLNQARLVLAARFDITEEAMERPISTILSNEHEIALFQIHFYGFIQECLIRGE